MKGDKKNDGVLDMFRKEYERLESYQKILENDGVPHNELLDAFTKLINDYQALLKDTVKITRIGDTSQHKLLKAKEKIEVLNEKLVESEKNVRELNTILMFYIKATDK
ncbi:MAG: hypothetical protein K0B37_04890 [Bacteroidales bacterium]|nr:hypothetical protein [Bacteroidales bacterium]